MRLSVSFLLICLFLGCSTRHPVEDAKAVVKSHEEFSKAGKLDDIMSNFADDGVFLTAGMPLIKGKDAIRQFYAGMLTMGKVEFTHQYDGAEIVGDAVVLHGIAKGTMTKPDSTVIQLANNFIMTLKYQQDGKMRFWRVAGAPNSQ
jgi:uncharacterized protein (TIGR02246 family)